MQIDLNSPDGLTLDAVRRMLASASDCTKRRIATGAAADDRQAIGMQHHLRQFRVQRRGELVRAHGRLRYAVDLPSDLRARDFERSARESLDKLCLTLAQRGYVAITVTGGILSNGTDSIPFSPDAPTTVYLPNSGAPGNNPPSKQPQSAAAESSTAFASSSP